MIDRNEVFEIGRLLKPHGVKGEITIELTADVDLDSLKCVVLPVDGIYVPFFIDSSRPKSTGTYLVKISGLDSDADVAVYSQSPLFALKRDVTEMQSEDGLYASDLIGCQAIKPDGELIGKIADVNDDTANTLFIIETPSGSPLLVPVAQEFITDINIEDKFVTMDLPEGLIDL